MIIAGWRKPARATAAFARVTRKSQPVPLTEVPGQVHRRTPIWRTAWSISALTVLAVAVAAVLATLLAFGLAWSVITLTDMLRS
jgi:hypothetical protein